MKAAPRRASPQSRAQARAAAALLAVLNSLPAPLQAGRVISALRSSLAAPGANSTAALASLWVPLWLAQVCGGLDSQSTVELQGIQLLVLCGVLSQDSIIDSVPRQLTPWDATFLLAHAQQRLAALFPPRAKFWASYSKLLREQADSARWELREKGKQQRLGPALLARLGSKAALMRWPAFAVAQLTGRPREARRLDELLRRLFIAHQLLDDLYDAEEDRAAGQPNAFNAALGKLSGSALAQQGPRLRATVRVCGAARVELRAIVAAVPEASGLATHCGLLLGWCDKLQQRAVDRAKLEVVSGILGKLTQAG